MRTSIKIISALALVVSIAWFIADRGYEPITTGLGALTALISLFVTEKRGKAQDSDENEKDKDASISFSNAVESTSLNRLTGTIDLSSIGNPEKPVAIFYAKRFKSSPCLNLRLVYAHGNLEILEQRPDGFKFMVAWEPLVRHSLPPLPGESPRDPAVSWFAEGVFQE